jgi:hypothetical protein
VTDIDYASRVARGIALMDEKWPEWATEIDLERLDIENSSACMTAQYAERRGEFRAHLVGQRLLGLDDRAYELHGFNADGESTGGGRMFDAAGYAVLNRLWREEILRRRAQVDTAPAEPEASS